MPDVTVWKLIPEADHYRINELSLKTENPSLDGISRLLPAGSYTTFRTYDGNRVIRFNDHLIRLQTAVKIIERNNADINKDGIRAALREVLANYPSPEYRIRLTLDLECEPGVVYITLEKFTPIAEVTYLQGVKAITCEIQRSQPKAKLTQFITPASEIRNQLPKDVHEGLIITDGKILEGLSSNFFAVKNGEIWTAEEGVLSGVTRSIVLDVIRQMGITVHFDALVVADIPSIDEAFITSSSRGIMPIVQIDKTIIASGEPGPLTRTLRQSFNQRIKDELVEI